MTRDPRLDAEDLQRPSEANSPAVSPLGGDELSPVGAPGGAVEPHEGIAPVAVTGQHEINTLLHDSLPRVLRRFALPAVVSNLLMTLFINVDAYWVGTRLGSVALAAVSTSMFWVWMVISLAEMVSVGLTAVAARRHGERRRDEAARVVGESMLYALLLGAVIAVVGTASLQGMFALMKTSPEVSELGRAYLGTYLLGAPLIYGYFAVDAAFRASGDTRTPLALLAASVAITLVLDPVLILGLFGAPRMGIAGAAVATVSTRGAAFLLGLFMLYRRGMVRFAPPRWSPLAAVTRIGLPTAMTGVTFSLIYVVLMRTTTRFGTPALAALGLGHRIESWLYMVGVGFGAAAAAIVGQNLGARQVARAERAGWIAVGYASIPGLAVGAAMLILPEQLAGIFTSDPAVIAETARYLRIAAVAQLVVCAEIVLEGALGGAGATWLPMAASTGFTALRIPLAAWAAGRWGTLGLWWVLSLTACARAIAMMLIWRMGRWKRAVV